MNILLTTLNSKFIHSNLAIKYLNAMIKDIAQVKVKEFTINEDIEEILSEITKGGYDFVAFSCYIWNIEKTLKIAENLKLVNPNLKIMFGGPEVSFNSNELLNSYSFLDYIIAGEGEEAVRDLVKALSSGDEMELNQISNLYFRGKKTALLDNDSVKMIVTDLAIIPPIYLDTKKGEIQNKIVYYETSRGCTFNCAYCLSAATRGVRFFDISRVKAELKHLVSLGAKQIKFVDRTFNSDEAKAIEMIEYLISIDDGNINFHFEITAYLLQKPVLELVKSARRGLFQFEIGVQSTNAKTLKAVNRADKFKALSENVNEIKRYKNIHQHLDLIAGLPYEDINSFKNSFNDVFDLKPDALQLGFLKILKGSPIEKKVAEHGYVYRTYPPYEVLYNSYISYKEIMELKEVEHILDRFYNTGRFKYSIEYLYDTIYKSNGYELFEKLKNIIKENSIDIVKKEEEFRVAKLLGEVLQNNENFNFEFFLELLKLDYINMGRNPNVPAFLFGEVDKYQDGRLKEFIFELTRDETCLRELGFDSEVHYKEAFKKISWTLFKYDIIEYICLGKNKIPKATENINLVVINYDSRRNHNGDFNMIRRNYEI